MNTAVFVDKDGTLIEDVPYNVDPAQIRLSAHAGQGLRQLRVHCFRLFVVSNQSGVALGRFEASALDGVANRVGELLRAHDAWLDGFYWCPHGPQDRCDCRKPAAGMLHRAARDHDIDLARSWMVGDILHDVEAGHRAGCRAVLIDNGNETEWDLTGLRRPDFVAADLAEAAALICGQLPNERPTDRPPERAQR